jgi:hypothetical protein
MLIQSFGENAGLKSVVSQNRQHIAGNAAKFLALFLMSFHMIRSMATMVQELNNAESGLRGVQYPEPKKFDN